MNYMLEFTICLITLSTPGTKSVNLDLDGPKWSYKFKTLLRAGNESKLERQQTEVESPEVVSTMMEKYIPKNEADDYIDHLFIEGLASTNKELAMNISSYNRMNEVQKINKAQAHIINKSTVHNEMTEPFNTNHNIFVRSQKVKNDLQITAFTKHIYKQTLKIFDAIKEKTTDENMKREIEDLAQNYEEKFGDFVRKTQNQNIKTRLEQQKVIINTFETSNLILKRLINYLVGMDNSLRRETAENAFKNEVNRKIEIENLHICKKFGICRSEAGFTDFTIDLITIILTANDQQIKEISEAFTEIVKSRGFSHIMNDSTEMHFLKGISDIKTYDVLLLKAILSILKNIMVNRNKPIEVVGPFDKRVNKTVVVLEMVDAFEKALPPNELNKLEWADIKNSVTEWKNGKRKDIFDITESYVDHLKRGIDSFDSETSMNFERNLNLILGSLKEESKKERKDFYLTHTQYYRT